MRKQLLCGVAAVTLAAAVGWGGAATAADLPLKAARPAPPPACMWCGLYIGGHVGAGWSKFDGDDHGDDPFENEPSGVAVGLHAGYNWQSGQWVFGVEGDATITPWEDSAVSGNNNNKLWNSRLDWLASIRGRVGYAFDRTLLYVTGGAAFVGANHRINIGDSKRFADTFDDMGFVVGGGWEFKYNPSLSFRLEGLYYGFDDTSTVVFGSNPAHQTLHDVAVVRVGASWYPMPY